MNPQKPIKPHSSGFALVVTMSLLALLLLVAVGLLSLSSISLRTSVQTQPQARAEANARLALMLAIGELQKAAGPDTRITANADIMDSSNPPVLGVWKSWEGTDHETSGSFQGRPVAPNYGTKKQSAGDGDSAGGGRFIRWLVSSPDPSKATNPNEVPDTKKNAGGKAILVGENSVGEGTQIHLTPVPISVESNRGSYAWWIGGENQKARLPKPGQTPKARAEWATQVQTHSTADPEPFDMETLLTDPTPALSAITLRQTDLLPRSSEGSDAPSKKYFYDLSTSSMGLLTNSATGGWRKDLSLLSEKWSQQPNTGLPLFRLTAEKNCNFTRPTSSPVPARSLFYYWGAYRDPGSSNPIYQHGPVASWANLIDHVTLYKKVRPTGNGHRLDFFAARQTSATTAESFNFLHRVRTIPVIARIQWVFSHYAQPSSGTLYNAMLLMTPVVTIWNPYNVEIMTQPGFNITLGKPIPVAFKYKIGGVANPSANFYSLTRGSTNYQFALTDFRDPPTSANPYPQLKNGVESLSYRINSSFTLKPGETRVFSPDNKYPAGTQATLTSALGKNPLVNGHYFNIKKGTQGEAWTAAGSSQMQVELAYDTEFEDVGSAKTVRGVGIFLGATHPFVGGGSILEYRMTLDKSVAQKLYTPPTETPGTATLAAASTTPVPFLSAVFGARVASNTMMAARGFAQSSPLVNFTAMGTKSMGDLNLTYPGVNHPVNSPFDYSFKLTTAADTTLPSSDPKGYIITGYDNSEGLSRCVVAEIPLRPLASLGELQHWNMRYENPVPPFQLNIIGNSDASPLFSSQSVVGSTGNNPKNLQHDDSYCANHVLFDDWFFSSIAAPTSNLGGTAKSIEDTYTEFVSGETPLANAAYQPRQRMVKDDPSSGGELYSSDVAPTDSWKKIASRLEVEGMFNVNSTSVTAWRALLGHARNQQIPVVKRDGNVDLSPETDHAFSRFNVAGDYEATSGSTQSGEMLDSAEFTGFRKLDDKVLDQLAQEMVNQVRKRGPFLSLSEFVNRQLSSDDDLALCGAIQAALNSVASGGGNPFSVLQQNSTPTSLSSPPVDDGYVFDKAAEGYSSYGLPGWTRQADVLRPLAPILSVRDDTFTIRAYGDARDSNNKIIARAVCEATVQRRAEFVDGRDDADMTDLPSLEVNRDFGRRFQVISYRWLTPGEI